MNDKTKAFHVLKFVREDAHYKTNVKYEKKEYIVTSDLQFR